MAQCNEEKEARNLADVHGTWIRTAKHGDLYRMPNDSIISIPRTNASHDPRTWKNCLADIKRSLKSNAVTEVTEEIGVTKTTTVKERSPLDGLAVTRRRKVTEVTEVLLSKLDLLKLLGLSGNTKMETVEAGIEIDGVKLTIVTEKEE